MNRWENRQLPKASLGRVCSAYHLEPQSRAVNHTPTLQRFISIRRTTITTADAVPIGVEPLLG